MLFRSVPFKDSESEKKVWNWVKGCKGAAAAPNAAEFVGEIFHPKRSLDDLWELTKDAPNAAAVFDMFRMVGQSLRAGRALNYGEVEQARAENMTVRPAVEAMKPQFGCHVVTAFWCSLTGAGVEAFLANSLMIAAVAAKIAEVKKKFWKEEKPKHTFYQADWGNTKDARKSRDGPAKKGDGKGKGASRSKGGSASAASPFAYMNAYKKWTTENINWVKSCLKDGYRVEAQADNWGKPQVTFYEHDKRMSVCVWALLVKLMAAAGAPNQEGRKCWFEYNRGSCMNSHDHDVWKETLPMADAPTSWPDPALSSA